jgi:hypothetical protein
VERERRLLLTAWRGIVRREAGFEIRRGEGAAAAALL